MKAIPSLPPEQYAANVQHVPVQSSNIVIDVLPETEHGTDR